jgi:signal transduction histidine kinase
MALFVVLAALTALLAAPLWRSWQGEPAASAASTGPAHPSTAPTKSHATPLVMTQLLAVSLAGLGAILTLALIIGLATRPVSAGGTKPPFEHVRTEMDALSKLAETSVAQGAELSRERDVRRRAEEDAKLKQQLLTQSLDEKIRLGQDLHDGIIQSLYATGLTLETVRALVKSNPEEADRRLEQTRANLNEAIRDVRAYIAGLTPEKLRRAGFAHGLSAMLSELQAGREAQFEIKIDDEAAALLTPEQSIEALQIAREAVSNALRHGRATAIALRMHRSEREVCLLVQDNGAGFNSSRQREGGHGLGNMRARAEKLGATLQVTSHPGEGARVLATLPILNSTAA